MRIAIRDDYAKTLALVMGTGLLTFFLKSRILNLLNINLFPLW